RGEEVLRDLNLNGFNAVLTKKRGQINEKPSSHPPPLRLLLIHTRKDKQTHTAMEISPSLRPPETLEEDPRFAHRENPSRHTVDAD
ncbi:unnamed protein product, partial [Musa acuminata subsp. burmannicoides]